MSRRVTEITRFLKFNVIGGMNTAVDFLVFTVLVFFHVPYLLAQVVSYSSGILNSYLFNRNWTFRDRKTCKQHKTVFRFLAVNLVTLLVSLAVLYGFTRFFGMRELASKVIATLFTMALNFAGQKYWVFMRINPQSRFPENDL